MGIIGLTISRDFLANMEGEKKGDKKEAKH